MMQGFIDCFLFAALGYIVLLIAFFIRGCQIYYGSKRKDRYLKEIRDELRRRKP